MNSTILTTSDGSTTPATVSNWVFARARTITYIAVVLGIVFRLRQYIFNRSLWLDESLLVLNILARSFHGLLKPLDHGQAAPFGFLLIEKSVVLRLGSGEMALRLFPFLCGIGALFLFVAVARRYVREIAVPIAVALFAVCGPLIYYSSEAKQYSSDVAIALTLYLVAGCLLEEQQSIARLAVTSLAGAIAVWFSQPSAFILAGIGLSGLWMARHDRRAFLRVFIPSAIWGASFLLYYFISLRRLTHDSFLLGYWQGSFAPLPPRSIGDLRWYVDTFFGVFANPVGLTFTGIAAVAAVLGTWELFVERKARLLALVLPLGLALLASGLHRYPFRERLLLFAVPALILLVAAGLGAVYEKTREDVPLLSALLIAALFLHPLIDAATLLAKPQTVEEIRPVLAYVQQHRSVGDILYAYHPAIYPLDYYTQRGVIQPIQQIDSIAMGQTLEATRQDLDRLRGQKRVWILFSHVSHKGGLDEEQVYLNYLDTFGKQLDSKQTKGSSAYLYDFSN